MDSSGSDMMKMSYNYTFFSKEVRPGSIKGATKTSIHHKMWISDFQLQILASISKQHMVDKANCDNNGPNYRYQEACVDWAMRRKQSGAVLCVTTYLPVT